jgi:hypothetical protein
MIIQIFYLFVHVFLNKKEQMLIYYDKNSKINKDNFIQDILLYDDFLKTHNSTNINNIKDYSSFLRIKNNHE